MMYAFVNKNGVTFVAAFDTEIQDNVSDVLTAMGIGCREYTLTEKIDGHEIMILPVITMSPALSSTAVEYAFQQDRNRKKQDNEAVATGRLTEHDYYKRYNEHSDWYQTGNHGLRA